VTRYGHGLVLGKFYPPHMGHHYLISRAQMECAEVTVVVLAAYSESIPHARRRLWLQEMHPGVRVVSGRDDYPVDFSSDEAWRAHLAVVAELAGRSTFDAVFTSERYGPRLAAEVDAAHVSIDPDRGMFPVSGRAIRRDPAEHWGWLSPAVRAALCRRVAIVGAESTGKTTLAKSLADRFDTVWAPEFGRLYTEWKRDEGTVDRWATQDFAAIAERQNAVEDEHARRSGPVLIADTNALATCAWEERYLGYADPVTERIAAARLPDLYLLTLADVPWVDDGLRDGNEAVRKRMTHAMRRRIAASGVPMVEVAGDWATREATAVAAIEKLVARGWQL
jgi:HTH-type transcriptional repressor of NAD biosynthesis genes